MKWLWRCGLILVVLLGLMAGALAWLGSREESLHWLLQRLTHNAPFKMEVQGLKGSVWSGVRAELIRLEHSDWRLELRQLDLHGFYWPPDHVHIPRLHLQQAHFEQLKRSDEPLEMPQSLALPFDLTISMVEIERLQISYPDSNTTTSTEIKKITASLSLGKLQHAIHLEQLMVADVKMQAKAEVQTSAPFGTKMSGQIDTSSLALAEFQLPWKKLYWDLSGDLTALKLKARWHSEDRRQPIPDINLFTLLRPFNKQWLEPLSLQVRDLHLSSLAREPHSPIAGWNALFDADIAVRLAQDRPVITLNIKNKVAGKWADKKIAFKTLHASIVQSGMTWRVPDFRLQDDSGLTMVGSAQAGQIQGKQQVQLELYLPGLQAQANWSRDRNGQAGWQAKVEAKAWNPASLNAAILKQDGRALPHAKINASLKLNNSASGIDFDLSLANSLWNKLALTGHAKGVLTRISADRTDWQLGHTDFLFRTAEARLQGAGALGGPQSRLSLVLSVPKLERFNELFGIQASGNAEIHAVVGGSINDPLLGASISATRIQWGHAEQPVIQAGRVNGYLQVVARSVEMDLNANRVKWGDTLFNEAGLQARGGLEQHVLNFSAQGAGLNRPVQASAEWAGGWFGNSQQGLWRGQWRRFDNQGQYRVRLRAPTPMEISWGRLKMSHADLEVADGRLNIEQLEYGAGLWRSRGSLEKISGQALARWFPALAAPRNTLMLGGRWEMVSGQQLNGEFQLSRHSGDLWLTTVSNQSLGLERLGLNVVIRNNVVEANFELMAKRAGQLQARLQTVLSQRDDRFGITGQAPLNGSIKGELTSLAWLGLLTEMPLSAEGKIQLDATASGTLGQPRLEGFLNGDDLVLRTDQPRATLRDGRIRLTLESGVLNLREFSFSGRTGRLNAQGRIDPGLRGEQGKIQVKLDRLDALTDPLYRLIASGEMQIALRDLQGSPSTRITGRIRADQARLTLKDITAPSLSQDVVVLNGATEVPIAQRRFPLDIDLDFEFGDDFQIAGYGAEAQLKGNLGLQARAGYPLSAVGTVQTVAGRYFAYGQELSIERGSLSFTGTLDNPGLNFYAIRNNLPVQVGVEVTGTVVTPKARLVSRPEMSNTEKISWLALGRGIDSVSRSDLQLLSLATSSLLDRGEGLPLNQRIARNIGLDDIGLRGGAGVEETIVTLGKRLSSRLYLTLERSLVGTSTLAKLRYEVARRWTLQAITGTESALDIFFTLSFD
jgi:translocation and assembly module TamB